jgi:hypothetical protein
MPHPPFGPASLTVILVLGSLACSDPAAPGSDQPLVRTSAPEYTVAANGVVLHAAIVATFTNRTRHPVYFDHCQPLALRLEVRRPGDDVWVRAYDPVVACPGVTDTRKLDAGDSRTDTLHVFGCLDQSCSPDFELVDEGEYRVVYGAAAERDLSEPLPIGDRVSNTFRIVPE